VELSFTNSYCTCKVALPFKVPFEEHSSEGAFGRSRELVVALGSSRQVVRSKHITIGVVGSSASGREHRNFIVGAHSTVAVASATDIPSVAAVATDTATAAVIAATVAEKSLRIED
jgi:hypothetical protein